jgi:hypothetical protein
MNEDTPLDGMAGDHFRPQLGEAVQDGPLQLLGNPADFVFNEPVPPPDKNFEIVFFSVSLLDQDPVRVSPGLDFVNIYLDLDHWQRNAFQVHGTTKVVRKNRKIHFPSRTIKLAFSQLHGASSWKPAPFGRGPSEPIFRHRARGGLNSPFPWSAGVRWKISVRKLPSGSALSFANPLSPQGEQARESCFS